MHLIIVGERSVLGRVKIYGRKICLRYVGHSRVPVEIALGRVVALKIPDHGLQRVKQCLRYGLGPHRGWRVRVITDRHLYTSMGRVGVSAIADRKTESLRTATIENPTGDVRVSKFISDKFSNVKDLADYVGTEAYRGESLTTTSNIDYSYT